MFDKMELELSLDEMRCKLQDAEYEIEDLKEELQVFEDREDIIHDDHVLINVARQLKIIVVPGMSEWVLLFYIERKIERMIMNEKMD